LNARQSRKEIEITIFHHAGLPQYGWKGTERLTGTKASNIMDSIQPASSNHTKGEIKILSLSEAEGAVRSSDVVCLATHSYVSVISAEWVQPGTHVSSVGVAPPGGELPIDLIAHGKLFVETRDSFAPTPAGCCELANIDPEAGTDLGAMLLGLRPGRTSDQQITIYKAMGVAMEDMVAADLAYREAKRLGMGQAISL
jgi:alanine dehydrogenase